MFERLSNWWSRAPQRVERLPDAVWLSYPAKLAGMLRAVRSALARPDGPASIVLVAHFSEVLDDLQELIQVGGLAESRVRAARAVDLACCVDDLRPLKESDRLDLLVGERHPLRVHDEQVDALVEQLSCRCRIQFHVSLDDALMSLLSGHWLTGALRQLGMQDDDAIEDRMVSRRLLRAQRMIAAKIVRELPADSQSEWVRLNCRWSP